MDTDLDWVVDKISAEIIQERLDIPCTESNVRALARLLKEFELSRSSPVDDTGEANLFANFKLEIRLDCTRI